MDEAARPPLDPEKATTGIIERLPRLVFGVLFWILTHDGTAVHQAVSQARILSRTKILPGTSMKIIESDFVGG